MRLFYTHVANQDIASGGKFADYLCASGTGTATKNQIIPCLGRERLDKITSEDINRWLLDFKERTVINAGGKEAVKSYKNTYANTVFGTFWLMLNYEHNKAAWRETAQRAFFICLAEFPQFKADLDVLYEHGYIKVTGDTSLEWTKTWTSLTGYFKWIGAPHSAAGGFWNPVSKCFGIPKRALSKGASTDGNPTKPRYSRDFKKNQKDFGRAPGADVELPKKLMAFQESKKTCFRSGKRGT
jgi:hypothetical protein